MMYKGESALEHDTRRMIFNHILNYPGVAFNVLKSVFNLNDSTLRYHLDYLERTEKISFNLVAGKRLYYPHQSKRIVIRVEDEMPVAHELTTLQEQIVNAIRQYPGITQKDLSARTGIQRLTLTNNLKKLMDLCIVRKLPDNRNVRYEYIENEQLRFEILKRFVVKLLKKEITEQEFLALKRKLE